MDIVPPPRLCVSSLSLRYGPVEVLRALDFSAGAGRIIGLLGPSGAGKSSLFKVLAGDIQTASGRVVLDGVDVTTKPLWRRARLGLSYLPQEPSVLFDCTVQENLATYSALTRGRRGGPARDWLAEFELGERSETRASELSGGERRRLELIRTLMVQASVYVLDEPFTGIDPARVERIAGLIRAEAKRGALVMLADHRVREVLTLCDEAWLLIDGEIRLKGEPEAFAEHPAVRSRYLQ